MPINVMDAHYRSFQKEVLPVCEKKGVGVIGMKGLGGGHPQGRFLEKAGLTAAECYRYALSLNIAVQVVGINTMDQLREDISLARGFTPMPASERAAILARVKVIAGDGRHELFKSTKTFDGPHHRRQHEFEISGL
jgi:predicted aldo/keto reductase-like oxidoreductase